MPLLFVACCASQSSQSLAADTFQQSNVFSHAIAVALSMWPTVFSKAASYGLGCDSNSQLGLQSLIVVCSKPCLA